jgi:hypothetical protein
MRTKTTEQFIQDARTKHGDRYDYSETRYTNAHTKIVVICPKHGRFEQKAYAHLRYGCKRCGNTVGTQRRATSVEDFLERAGELHNYKYDYRFVAFSRQHAKIAIICPAHGIFEQAVNDHLKGHGCAKCGSLTHGHRPTIRPDEFFRQASEKHGDQYSYDKTRYRNAQSRVTITCREHGDFKMLPSHHLAGNGCRLCAQINGRLGFAEFVRRARLLHGEQYDYVEYQDATDPVGILCASHGFFRQRGADHLAGHGCPCCTDLRSAGNLRYTRNEIKDEIKIKFDNHVTLAEEYLDTGKPVRFACIGHGDFEAHPMTVLQSKHGCPRCADESFGLLSRRLTQEEFERTASAAHAGKYKYGTFSETDNPIEVTCPRHGSFLQKAGNHLAGYGCPHCSKRRCAMQKAWLDKLGISKRDVAMIIDDRRFIADGYEPSTKTVYEFWGDFWHGNPRVYKSNDVNTVCNVTFGELYEKTKAKVKKLITSGYQVIEIWEHDWRRMNE